SEDVTKHDQQRETNPRQRHLSRFRTEDEPSHRLPRSRGWPSLDHPPCAVHTTKLIYRPPYPLHAQKSVASCRMLINPSKLYLKWSLFGIAVGLLTEYATGANFVEQLKIIVSNLGIAELD
uniref:Uncharacterized protein n=1 Tax=Physcomitrium patens TaxID=3218 RepID=A0A7I4C074_PHYPA